jgi:pheromone shutdown-related protein TraB
MSFENRLKIVGTSHISSQSVEYIKKEFLNFSPEHICVELDNQRLYSLLHPQQKSAPLKLLKQLGLKGFIFAYFARYAQQKLGRLVGMQPGSDMLFAVQLAKNNNLKLHLIDRNIQITIKRLMKKLTFKEKARFAKDLFLGLFFKKSQPKVKIDLNKVPSKKFISNLLEKLKKTYPTLYEVLVEERNHYMARQTVLLLKKNHLEKFLVVVGAGHEEELFSLVDFYDKKIDAF